MNPSESNLSNGPAAAATLAAGIGCVALGLLSTLSEVSHGIGSILNFYNPTGPLSGKTLVAVVIWLVSWGLLKRRFADHEVNFTGIFILSLVLVGLGFLGTFPPFFDLLAD